MPRSEPVTIAARCERFCRPIIPQTVDRAIARRQAEPPNSCRPAGLITPLHGFQGKNTDEHGKASGRMALCASRREAAGTAILGSCACNPRESVVAIFACRCLGFLGGTLGTLAPLARWHPGTPGTPGTLAPWHPGTLALLAPWHPGPLSAAYNV